MEALYVRPVEEERRRMGEERRGREWGAEASSPTGFITDEETDEDTDPGPRPVVRRRVSFADAFGLNLVSVKEFDDVEATGSEVADEQEARRPSEEFYMSCLFTVPSSLQDLDQRLQVQMVELESVELLPGTTTLRGVTRVVNLCYSKSVYVRVTLDRWNSYFDLSAEYVPGSSDRKTDRFTFTYTVALPLDMEGTRVEFCLRYETSVGTFWANNKGMNYVIFCHQKGHVKEQEGSSHKSKRGCLKLKRRGIASERTKEMTNRAALAAEAEEDDRKAETRTLSYREEHKPLVDRIKSRQRTARAERMKDVILLKKERIPSHDLTPWGASKIPQVLTYHQIPLITLDWGSDKPQQWATPAAATAAAIWTDRATLTSKVPETPSVNDAWETFLNGKGAGAREEASVCDAWQAFLNVSGCTDHSTVPESEWLQTAASVSPSDESAAPCWPDRESQSQTLASQLSPPGTAPAIVASNTKERIREMDTVTATPAPRNASADDRISHAGSVEAEVTGTAHNATDDTLAFVFSAPRLAAEEGIGRNGAGHKGDVIFRPRKPDEHEVSRRNADENQRQELKQNGGKPLNHHESDRSTMRRVGWETEDDAYVARYVEKTAVGASTSSSKADGQEKTHKEQEAAAVKNMDADGALTSDRGGRVCAVKPPEQVEPAQPDDPFAPLLKDTYDPNRAEVLETTRSRSEEEAAAKENDTSTEQRETSGRGDRGSIRTSKPAAAVGELVGNEENPQGGGPTASVEPKELSAPVERENPSEGTGATITAENAASLQEMEMVRPDKFSERSGEDSLRGSLEGEKTDVQASSSGDPSHNHDSDDAAVHRRQPANVRRTAGPTRHKHAGPPESDGLVWWVLSYVVTHVTRLLLCSLLAVGFAVLVFLYDFPAVFALYTFTVCGWFYKWKTHQGPANKMMVG